MKSLSLSALLVATTSADTAITIYNQNLAVIRETIPLELSEGINSLSFDQATAQVISPSVVLRDPSGTHPFSILEQSYRNDPVNRSLLLSHFEGQTIEFRNQLPNGQVELVKGKIVRSGHVPGGQVQDPIIEVDGTLRFQLPGEPLFPALGDDSILRPTLGWQINSPAAVKFDAQLSYLSRGFQWEAAYNFVAPEKGETASLTGWITAGNHSGTDFKDAKVKLVAGEVNIVKEHFARQGSDRFRLSKSLAVADAPVEEKAFDDFHLYTLARPLTIRNRESKQVEFIRAPKVTAKKVYYYDPAQNYRYHGSRNDNPLRGQQFSKNVRIFWQFTNDEASGLGMPLPAGRVRFYRSDDADGNLEFIGENNIGHTPRNEKLKIFTGDAFDLVGERKITNFARKDRENWMKESVEVTVKNRSKDPKTIIVREHLWRWSNWTIKDSTMDFRKEDAQTIEFTVDLQPDEKKTLSYTAHYSW